MDQCKTALVGDNVSSYTAVHSSAEIENRLSGVRNTNFVCMMDVLSVHCYSWLGTQSEQKPTRWRYPVTIVITIYVYIST